MNRSCRNGKSYSAGTIHDEFLAFLGKVAPRFQMLSALKAMIVGQAEENSLAERKRVDQRNEQSASISSQITQLIKMRSQDLITDKEFLTEKVKFTTKIRVLDAATNIDQVSFRQIHENIDEILKPLTNLPETWGSLTVLQRERFHQCVLPGGFAAGQIGTADLGLLFEVLRQSEPLISQGVPLTDENWNRLDQEIQAFASLFDHSTDEKMAA